MVLTLKKIIFLGLIAYNSFFNSSAYGQNIDYAGIRSLVQLYSERLKSQDTTTLDKKILEEKKRLFCGDSYNESVSKASKVLEELDSLDQELYSRFIMLDTIYSKTLSKEELSENEKRYLLELNSTLLPKPNSKKVYVILNRTQNDTKKQEAVIDNLTTKVASLEEEVKLLRSTLMSSEEDYAASISNLSKKNEDIIKELSDLKKNKREIIKEEKCGGVTISIYDPLEDLRDAVEEFNKTDGNMPMPNNPQFERIRKLRQNMGLTKDNDFLNFCEKNNIKFNRSAAQKYTEQADN